MTHLKKLRNFLPPLFALSALGISSTGTLAKEATPPTKSIASVNGTEVPAAWSERLVLEQRARGGSDTPELRNAIRESLINQTLLAGEARRLGLDKNPEVTAQIELSRLGLLVRAWEQEYLRTHTIPDSAYQQEYNAWLTTAGNKEYLIRHILLESEDEAKGIVSKLQGGIRFAELASFSQDKESGEKGGLLGWSIPAALPPAIGNAIGGLESGKFTSTPVRSEFGWHVIQVDEIRPFKAPALEALKPQIGEKLARQALSSELRNLREKARIR